MKRVPPYVVVALCGLAFISAGLIGMFADSTETPSPADSAAPTMLPTATLTLTPIPMELVAPAPVVVEQPQNNPPPVVVESPPVAPIESTPVEVVLSLPPPTENIPTVLPSPTESVSTEALAAVGVPTQLTPVELLPTLGIPTEVVPTEVVPVDVLPTATIPVDTLPTLEPTTEAPVQDSRDVPGAPVDAPLPTKPGPVDSVLTPTVEPPVSGVIVPTQAVPVEVTVVAPTPDPARLPTAELILPTSVPADANVVPTVAAQISGLVTFQEAQDHTGILVLLTLPDGTQLQNTTGTPGTFEFLNLKPGTYRIEAGAQGYLSRQIEFTLAEGETLQLPPTFLVAGDTNFDNIIDVNDAALVASNFDGPATVQTADPNRDGWVDVRDLALIGADFGLSGPIPWQ